MSSMEGRIAVVTGSGRGIGASIAWRLVEDGATVIINDIDAERAQRTADEIGAAGHTAMAVPADVGDTKDAERMIKSVIDAYGRVDILVNNAGLTRDQLIMKLSEDDWDLVIRVNLKSAYNCSKAVIRNMMRNRYGRIVNMASVAGIAGNAGQTNYSASKAGLIGFSRALAREVASRNITVNAVAPGFVPTDLTDVLPDAIKEGLLGQIPLGRFGTTDEVANAVAFLASDEASYITGQVLSVDGGMVMG